MRKGFIYNMAATDTAARSLSSSMLMLIISKLKDLIPTTTKDLTNNSGFITAEDTAALVSKTDTADQNIASTVTIAKDVHVGGNLYLSDGSYLYIKQS